MSPEELLQSPDWYEHDGPHRAISVAQGAVCGYWYGQPDWRPKRRWNPNRAIPACVVYAPDRVEDCCGAYGFRKGYRFRNNDYSDRQSDEELRRFEEPQRVHMHNPLAVARGAVIGYAYGRAGNIKPRTAPADMIQSCCARYGFGQGIDGGIQIFFENASKAEKARYFDSDRAQRNEDGWG
ncbi:hypothetical protein ACFV80_44740 [Streptomyces sp. NPDC059862]|uniref:hypothetical protein n=1 Tax=Streptomyces sp. NPDC059862 TaxID=3346975 RepID=UPI0036466CAF